MQVKKCDDFCSRLLFSTQKSQKYFEKEKKSCIGFPQENFENPGICKPGKRKKSPFLLESKSKFDWGQSLRYVRSTLASISVRALDFVVIGHKLSRTTKANSPKAGEREKRSWLTRTTLAFHALASSARMQYSRLQAEYSAHSPPNSLTLSLVQLRKLDKSSGPVRTTSRSMSSRPTFGECMGCMVLTLHSCIPL